MNEVALEFNHVWKKFKKGEKYNSLRDLIPAMTKRLFSGNHREELEEKEFWAVRDVSFQLKRGEVLGIIGSNGAGKSTILKLLSGILRPNKGEIKVNGRLSALIEVSAGFHPDLTGRENIYLNGSILGMKKKEIDGKFDQIVAFSELEEFVDTPVKRYSSGMFARLGFSVAAHLDPDILLIDEVLSVGDISFQAKCLRKIRSLKQDDKTIVFISHNMEAVLGLCPRSIFLYKGTIISDGDTDKVITQYRENLRANSTKSMSDDQRSGPVRIASVSFLDESGNNRLAFETGHRMVIKVTLEAFERISRPVLGIAFYDENGACVFGHNSKVDKHDLGDVHGTYEAEVEYEYIDLQPGNYLVTVAVFDSLALKPYEYKDREYTFMVNGDIGEIGLIHIPHTWKKT